MSIKQKIITIEKTDKKEFDTQVNIMVNQGYKIESNHNISNKYSVTLSYKYDENDNVSYYENDFIKEHTKYKDDQKYYGDFKEKYMYFENGNLLYRYKENEFEIFHESGKILIKGYFPFDKNNNIEFKTISHYGDSFNGKYCEMGTGGGSGRYDFYIKTISDHIISGIDQGIVFKYDKFPQQYEINMFNIKQVKPNFYFQVNYHKDQIHDICVVHFTENYTIHSISHYEIKNNDLTKFIPKNYKLYNKGELLINYERKFYVDLFNHIPGYRGHYDSIYHDGVLSLYDGEGKEIIEVENLFLNTKSITGYWYRDSTLNDSQKIISWRWKIRKKYSSGELLFNNIPDTEIQNHVYQRGYSKSKCSYINKIKYYDYNQELVLELEGCDSQLDTIWKGSQCYWKGNKIKDVYIQTIRNSCINSIMEYFDYHCKIKDEIRNDKLDEDFLKNFKNLIEKLINNEESDETFEETMDREHNILKDGDHPCYQNEVMKKITEQHLERIKDIIKNKKNKF